MRPDECVVFLAPVGGVHGPRVAAQLLNHVPRFEIPHIHDAVLHAAVSSLGGARTTRTA